MTGAQLRVGADTLWLEDRGSGTPLRHLHPGITDSQIWDRMLPLLAGHRVVCYDRPGFGRSPVARELLFLNFVIHVTRIGDA